MDTNKQYGSMLVCVYLGVCSYMLIRNTMVVCMYVFI